MVFKSKLEGYIVLNNSSAEFPIRILSGAEMQITLMSIVCVIVA